MNTVILVSMALAVLILADRRKKEDADIKKFMEWEAEADNAVEEVKNMLVNG